MSQRVLVIDDDADLRTMVQRLLQRAGYEVNLLPSADTLESTVGQYRPDVVLCDIMMPGRDGMDVLKQLRGDPETRGLPVVLVSGKSYEVDRRAALDAGAAGYLVKPFQPSELIRTVNQALKQVVTAMIWGCRGSIPAPERALGFYGGNTSCVDLVLPGNRHIIFDAGTGIRLLGNAIVGESPMRAALFLTHYHWDHIHGLPFFKPLYVPGNEIHIYGPAEDTDSLTSKIAREMGGDYFPVSLDSFRSAVRFTAMQDKTIEAYGVTISALYTLHPGRTLAYRVECGDRSFVYAPDNELLPESVHPKLTGEAMRLALFAKGASLFMHDAMYSREMYERRRGWGHSCGECLAAVCAQAEVKRVLLFHHDPDNTDAEVEAIHREFQRSLSARGVEISSEPAREGGSYVV